MTHTDEVVEKLKKSLLEEVGIATYGGVAFEATGMYRDKIYKIFDTLIEAAQSAKVEEVREKVRGMLHREFMKDSPAKHQNDAFMKVLSLLSPTPAEVTSDKK